jgi:2-succinyl-6-hydroxy-2,4-cyclohexadiene-1-carboxylate synthase
LLHGFLGSGQDWDGVVAVLKEKFYCVTVDLPGHDLSLGLPSETYTFRGATRELSGLIHRAGIRRPLVVGYSMGGRLALYFALRHPEQCSGLFLESASPGLESAQERAARRQNDEEKAAQLESGDFEEFLQDWYRQPLFASLAQNERLLQKTIESRRRNEPEELARSLRGMGTGSQPSLWGELAGLRATTLAVAGELDKKFVNIGRLMEAESSVLRLTSVPMVGHNVRAEAPAAYTDLLQRFLHFDNVY